MSIKSYISGKMTFLATGIRRFVFPFIYTAVATVVASYGIITERNTEDVIRLILALAFGFFASILLTLIAERYQPKINTYLLQAMSLAAAGVCWIWMKDYTTDVYAVMGYVGIMAATVACILFFLYHETNRELLAPHLLKGFVFSYVVAGILQGGLALCLTAFDAIILDIPELWKYIAILGIITGVLVAVNLFLSGVPRAEDEIVIPKVLRILVGTVGLPIYLLLVLILYVYLGKILITWNLPSNEINLYASLAALFFILFYLTVGSFAKDNKLVALFMKWGKYALIPIILVQLYAIHLRVSAYGITTPRYISIILVSVVLLFLIFAIVRKGKYLKGIFAAIAIIAIFFTFTPWNVIDVPDRVQYGRLVALLEENGMYNDGEVIPNRDISKEDKWEITNIFEYLVYRGGNDIDFIVGFRNEAGYRGYDSEDFKNTFGFLPYHVQGIDPGDPEVTYYSNDYIYEGLDLGSSVALISNVGLAKGAEARISEDSPSVSLEGPSGKTFEADIYATLVEIAGQGQSGSITGEMTLPVKDGKYCITRISFRSEQGAFYLEYVDGFVLLQGMMD